MATIINFSIRRAAILARRGAAPQCGADAENGEGEWGKLILFTGVRYERESDVAVTAEASDAVDALALRKK